MHLGAFCKHIGAGHLAVTSLLVLVLSVAPSAAQDQWRQTAQVIAPVEEGTVTRALLDSVVSVVEREGFRISSSPQGARVSVSERRDSLSSKGLALSSATHVFITYRFSLSSSTLDQEIRDLYFIFRPAGQEEDIPILHVDLQEGAMYEELLIERGTRLAANESAFVPFRRQLSFHNLRSRVTVVKVGDEIIRDPDRAAAEKERLLDITRELTYN